jgi:hypothetical protein
VLREGLSTHTSEGQEARNNPEVTEFAIGREAAESMGTIAIAINEKELLLTVAQCTRDRLVFAESARG